MPVKNATPMAEIENMERKRIIVRRISLLRLRHKYRVFILLTVSVYHSISLIDTGCSFM